ncbi:MAG: ATP-binding cassette domain-containing protein [Streptococcaceae bacterium]|jgi:D-methionine transport system ATP-binding protein|nr:ATP-binding cassette domain-containing protein [Streptococcaceae bacterium]
MIELNELSVRFASKKRQIVAVDNVSLTVDAGDIYGIVGYSGAGKSTLVRVINLLQRPTAGSVRVDGKVLTELSAHALRAERKKIGMIFQHFNLMESRTIADNVAFPLSGLTADEKRKKVDELLTLVGILDKKDAYPAQLSGGQKQRVAIARALANEPKVLLCDEATSALDPKTTLDVLALLKELNQKLGITIVLITHEMQVVKEICNKVAVMQDGRVIERGSTVEIFSNPKETLTQDFIRTATHIEQAEAAVLANNTGDLYELSFNGESTSAPIIIELYEHFGLTASIIYGNTEYIQGVMLGVLIVSFDKKIPTADVSNYLAEQAVSLRKLTRPQLTADRKGLSHA